MDKNRPPGGSEGFSITQAGNYLRERKKDPDKAAAEGMKGAKVSVASPKQRRTYLKYCISLMTRPQDQDAKVLLIMRAEGMSHRRIAYHSRLPVEEVVRLEKEAIKRAQDAIVKRKLEGVPILGGR